uniref:recombinase family protein n=2 Tax=Gemmiger formicilis TaxID=745368 RepID=UPI003FEE7C6E
MNAVIYARYSSDNQREESIEGQLRECKEYADQNGITVVRTYIDRALSAKTDSRPQFQQMIHDSATHTFEAVLVWKLDRFSRNRYDSAHYKRILKNNRVHVVSVTEPISNTPEGIMLESLLEGMAEYYSAELAEKVSRGHKENALKAKFNGGPVPLGYRIDSEHHYQIDPATAPVVQEAFQRYAAGESIRSIIESLNARGIPNSRGNRFTKNSFQTLLKNRRYLGEYRYKDTVILDAIPAIIDPECFDAVQRRCEIHRQAPAHNKADVHYLLTTKLFCGKCGTMMAGESGRSHTGTVHCYYKCGTRKRSGKEACSLKPVRKEPLEQFVVKTALEKVLNDRVIDLLADKLLEYQSKENTRLPVLQAELKEVKRRIDNLVAAIEQGILTPSTKSRMEELEQQREALETSILQEQIETPPITREQILFWFDQFRHGDPADIAFQEKVIDCFVNSIYLFDDRIVVNFNYQEGGRPVSLEEVLSSFLDGNGAPKKALRKRKAFFILLLTSTQVSGSFCFVGEKFIPPGDATTAANGSGGPFLLPCTAAICYTKEKTEGEALRMTRIAIVEDEAAVREQLAGYVQRYTRQYGTQFEVTMFTDGVEILEDYRPVYDIIFLDVEMLHLDGMETARRIRELDSDVLLIFITNMAQYAIKGYAVGALDYVLKPVPYFAFSQQLQKAVNQLAKRTRHYLAVPVDGGMRRLDAATIYYIESEGHRVHFYTEDGDFSAPGALKALEEKLTGRLFARCNSGYLVNLAQVSGVQQNTVQVGPHELQISRPKRRAFLAALADYIGGEGA